MSHNDYGFTARLLHRIALGVPFVTQATFDIDKALTKIKQSRCEQHLFITGMTRAGTTILLRALHETKVYRSLTYRDMPFVLMPNTWKRLSAVFRTYENEKERAHGDRIKVSFDSPEAFEEVFWRTFCGNDYIKADHLCPHSVDSENLDAFVAFVSLIIASGNSTETRYLSKNNNNLLRLAAIREAFPNAIILIPFRHPIQQANSLLKQHILFSERHRRDRFSYDYMRWLAHHEFGLTHKPFRFALPENTDNVTYNPSHIDYWLNRWLATYSYVVETMPERALLVSYEALCSQSAELLSKILQISNIEYDVGALTTEFQAAPISKVEGLDPKLVTASLSLYEKMCDRMRD